MLISVLFTALRCLQAHFIRIVLFSFYSFHECGLKSHESQDCLDFFFSCLAVFFFNPGRGQFRRFCLRFHVRHPVPGRERADEVIKKILFHSTLR